MIKDSGARRQFYGKDGEELAVRDIQTGKGRMDLVPIDVMYDVMYSVFDDDVIEPIGYIAEFKNYGKVGSLIKAARKFIELRPFGDGIDQSADYATDCATAMMELSIHYEEGALKYGEHNWEKGIPVHCYIDSALRHYMKWLAGWNDEPHNRAFLWNLFGAIWTMYNKPEMDDYTTKEPSENPCNQEKATEETELPYDNSEFDNYYSELVELCEKQRVDKASKKHDSAKKAVSHMKPKDRISYVD